MEGRETSDRADMNRMRQSVGRGAFPPHRVSVACAAIMLLLLAGCAQQEWDGFLWRIQALGPTIESGFVLCTSRGAFLVDAQRLTMRLIARGEYCAADTKDRYILTSRPAGRSAVLTLYRLENGKAARIGSVPVYGRVKGVVPAPCFAPYRFAVIVFSHGEHDLVGGTQVGLVRIEPEAELSWIDSTPVLSGFANLHRPDGIVFSPTVEKPGLAASVMLSLPGCRVLKAMPGVVQRDYEEGYLILVSGGRLVRAWRVGVGPSARPIRYSADGGLVLVGIAGEYKIIDASSAKVRESLDLPQGIRILAADGELRTLVWVGSDEGKVFWRSHDEQPRLILETDMDPMVGAFAGQRAVVTNGRHIWVLGQRGIESQGRLREVAP